MGKKWQKAKHFNFLVLPPADGGDVENVVATDEGVPVLVLQLPVHVLLNVVYMIQSIHVAVVYHVTIVAIYMGC